MKIDANGVEIRVMEMCIRDRTEARPYVAEISTHLGMAAFLGVLDGNKVVYLEKMNVASARLYFQIGTKVSAYCSAIGKCLLSNYSNEQLNDVIDVYKRQDMIYLRMDLNCDQNHADRKD